MRASLLLSFSMVPALWACGSGAVGGRPDDGTGAADADADADADDARDRPGDDDPVDDDDDLVPEENLDTCGDGLDDDGDGAADDGCTCEPASAQDCYPGDPALAGVGACALGRQACVEGFEFAQWGDCAGAVLPVDESCNELDDDCDGVVDDVPGGCDRCEPGRETCNGVDDDCDGRIDEAGCTCLEAGLSPWEELMDEDVHCFGEDLDEDPDEFDFADIPDEDDDDWRGRGDLGINFDDDSTIPDDFCDGSHTGGVFTYFQTFLDLPEGFEVDTLVIEIGGVDDGTEVRLFNARFPNGRTENDWIAFDDGSTSDLAPYLAVGRNRIVLTHIDDNPSSRSLWNVRVRLDGGALEECP